MKLTKEHKQKAAELVEFYTKLQDADVLVHRASHILSGPGLGSDLGEYELITKPKLKPVDLSVLIESRIDCEFSDNGTFSKLSIGKLSALRVDGSFRYARCHYARKEGYTWRYCRPRMNHPHAWIPTKDSKCPLPEGFKVMVYLRDWETPAQYRLAKYLDWSSNLGDPCQIIAFEVLPDLEEGYCWPWEVEEDNHE